MGLVQLLRNVPCPDLMARHLLDAALADFRESAHHQLVMLVAQRDLAYRNGDAGEFTALTAQIHKHTEGELVPERWEVDFLFSRRGYEAYGDLLLAVWAIVLIEICTLEQHWARLEEARHTWSGGLEGVLADAAKVLAIVVLPAEPGDSDSVEAGDGEPAAWKEAELDALDVGPWIH